MTNGRLVWLPNTSGNFLPTVAHLLQTLQQIRKGDGPMTLALALLPEKKTHATAAIV